MNLQARVQAERKLDGFGTHPDEEQVWQVVDMLAQALRQTREQDILNECRAHAKLGQVFDKYLKMRSKAVQNCKRAVQLAHHVKPHPVGHDWYMVSSFDSLPVCLSVCWSVCLCVCVSVSLFQT